MIKFKPYKISHKLTITYALLFFIALALVNFATLFSINYYINQNSTQQLKSVDQAIKSEVKLLNDIQKIDLKQFSQIANNVDISLIINNEIIYNTGEKYILSTNITGNVVTTVSGDNNIMYLNDIITLKDDSKIVVQIVKDMNNEENYMHVLSGIMLSIDGLVFLMAIIVGFIISKKALSPIDKIINQAQRISASDLSKRIQIDGPDDELKRLADTFNSLISRIQYSYEKQSRFTIDASHELATPLAVIKGYIDLLDRWGKNDPAILNESIASIKVELSNIIGLIDMLFLLSKGDNDIYKIVETTFWMNDLIKEVITESNLIYKNHQIYSSSFSKFQIKGDKSLVKQMLRAILDNSIKYSPENTRIDIEFYSSDNKAVISISDEGSGIPKEDLPYIFERFYRVDKARSRSIGGSGLGLSIVKWIVEIHKGTIEVESEIDKGMKITIILPLKD